MTVKGRGEVLRLAEDLGLELSDRAESFLRSLANWLSASDELEFVENYRTDWGVAVHDPGDLEVAPGVLTSKPMNFASYPGRPW